MLKGKGGKGGKSLKSKWAAVRKMRTSLARLAAFDRSKQAVLEYEDCEHIVDRLSSENIPARVQASKDLVRAGIFALQFLPRVCALMKAPLWTQRLTGVEALGSIALAEPTCDRLLQAYERLYITDAEVTACHQRYFRLFRKKEQRKRERIDIAVKLMAMGHPVPRGVSASDLTDDEGEHDEDDIANNNTAAMHNPFKSMATKKKKSSNLTSLFAGGGAAKAGGAAGAEGGGVEGSGGGFKLPPVVSSKDKLPSSEATVPVPTDGQEKAAAAAAASTKKKKAVKPKKVEKTAQERALADFVRDQGRLAFLAHGIEKRLKKEMEEAQDLLLALNAEHVKTRDQIFELEATISSCRRTAMRHGFKVMKREANGGLGWGWCECRWGSKRGWWLGG
jgi:hypothetical protein